ncbi:hypothetical protein SAMN05444920_10744 [Nonomuraea solani]|uniref:PA domain-containing protein n=1 Tax=Nonomuraea solani TaxID=1144553 RepID=A0A1H6DZ92_9ACTN|nr:PA domain-containing protein [Nonomuraea solani]SEG90501.1 hypothetical protein SAMN05444920_10744 [Nonomuraea solani]
MLRGMGRMGRLRRGTVMAVTTAVAASLLSAPGAHATTAPPVTFTGDAASDEITLITGDRVRVRAVDGAHQAVTVTPAPRPDGSVPAFQVLESEDGVTVIPDDIAAQVPERLDAALFNVTELAGQDYGGTIPVIITYAGQAPEAAVTLESIGGVGVSLAAPAKLEPGVTKVWLDRETANGRLSAIIDGLEKAAAEKPAEAVKVAEAGGPVEAAVKRLTERYGTRFDCDSCPSTESQASAGEERVELRVRGIARDGRPGRGGFTVLNLDEGTLVGRVLPGDPAQPCTDAKNGSGTCLLVKPGTYSVLGHIFTMPATQPSTEGGKPLNESLVGDPEMEITRDTEVVLDAREAVEVEIETPDHVTKRNTGAAAALKWYRAGERGTVLRGGTTISPGGQIEERLFVQPTRQVTKGTFVVATRWRLKAPEITLTTPGVELSPQYVDPVQFSDFATEYPRLDGTRELTAVNAGRGGAEEIKALNLRGRLAVIRRTDGVPVSAQANAAAAAGAAMVALYSDRPGADVTTGGSKVKLAVPTVRLTHEEGLALIDRLGRLPAPVVAQGEPASPYVYDLYLREQGRVRDSLTYVVKTADLARIDTGYHTQLSDDVTVNETRFVFEPWDTTSISSNLPMAQAPRTRVDYVTPGADLRWSSSAIAPERHYNTMWPHPETPRVAVSSPEFRPYEAGERVTTTVFQQPLLPGVNPRNPLRREGDKLRVSMQGFVDAAGNYGDVYTSTFERGMKTDFRLYQGDDLLWRTEFLPSGSGTLTPGKATYRIEYDLTNEAEWAKMSTRTRGVWTFASERAAEPTVIPLLLATFDAPVDLKNRTSARTLEVKFRHQEGAAQSAVKDVTLEASYDDGATWLPAVLRDKGDRVYEATLTRPRPGFVSLRLKASDVNGNTVSQEVVRAYALS